MSFKGLVFIRRWAKEDIDKPRVFGEPRSRRARTGRGVPQGRKYRRRSSLNRLRRKSASWK
ncbi:hypothetical protein MAXJ12_33279 [Mesorhizobium alhagi CCNWXJ12-2]|uniref:Uncharacterized protein n=1 Tax=Mesorhizobium alhagi CCNWXJ12-2 TaxID=1107882 RepID=H0I2F4_9HYPH|nr:hypothetical protein MAXJ12_33279 [Mesorhizobium alhagi CCNWXJ12-2]